MQNAMDMAGMIVLLNVGYWMVIEFARSQYRKPTTAIPKPSWFDGSLHLSISVFVGLLAAYGLIFGARIEIPRMLGLTAGMVILAATVTFLMRNNPDEDTHTQQRAERRFIAIALVATASGILHIAF